MRRCTYTVYCAKGKSTHAEQKQGWFHGLFTDYWVLEPSPMVGGHPGGQMSQIFCIVETKKGELLKVPVDDVCLTEKPDEEGRPCEFFVPDRSGLGMSVVSGKREGEWKPGRFHGWSTDYEEFEAGPGPFPVGIVEDEEGAVHSVYAGNVRFPKRQNP